MELIVKHFTELHAEEITIEAQVYARSLYEKLGFRQTSEEFLEDGIPHIQMRRKRQFSTDGDGNS